MTLNTYSHVIRELRGTPAASAEEVVLAARRGGEMTTELDSGGPSVDHVKPG